MSRAWVGISHGQMTNCTTRFYPRPRGHRCTRCISRCYAPYRFSGKLSRVQGGVPAISDCMLCSFANVDIGLHKALFYICIWISWNVAHQRYYSTFFHSSVMMEGQWLDHYLSCRDTSVTCLDLSGFTLSSATAQCKFWHSPAFSEEPRPTFESYSIFSCLLTRLHA